MFIWKCLVIIITIYILNISLQSFFLITFFLLIIIIYLHAVIWHQVLQSHTNNLHIVIWFQVLLSNANNLYTIMWLQVIELKSHHQMQFGVIKKTPLFIIKDFQTIVFMFMVISMISGVCLTWEPTQNFELRPLLNPIKDIVWSSV